jgi:hypothetical protein
VLLLHLFCALDTIDGAEAEVFRGVGVPREGVKHWADAPAGTTVRFVEEHSPRHARIVWSALVPHWLVRVQHLSRVNRKLVRQHKTTLKKHMDALPSCRNFDQAQPHPALEFPHVHHPGIGQINIMNRPTPKLNV